jgi:hypothetical protein
MRSPSDDVFHDPRRDFVIAAVCFGRIVRKNDRSIRLCGDLKEQAISAAAWDAQARSIDLAVCVAKAMSYRRHEFYGLIVDERRHLMERQSAFDVPANWAASAG